MAINGLDTELLHTLLNGDVVQVETEVRGSQSLDAFSGAVSLVPSSPDDGHVIPHGVDLEMFAPESKERAQRRLGWDRGKRHVLFPYETAREEKDFPRTKRLVAATRERLRAPVVLHTPHPVPHGSMPVYLNASDALLVTSTSEGSPNVVKEALACNVPVVSTDVGDVRRLVDGIAQSHVRRSDSDLVDALVSVLEAGRRADGRSRAEDLSVGRMADRILAVYERILVDP